MSSKKRILVLSVSAGAGHVRAAQALVRCAQDEFDAVAQHIDVMDCAPSAFRKLYAEQYLALVTRYPLVWAKLYQITDRAKPSAPAVRLRRLVERLNTRKLRDAIAAFAPDAIVCTHFLPAELLMHEQRRDRLAAPVFVQVTDFDLHALWVVPNLEGYFAASDEVAARMVARGLPAERVHTTGIPIVPDFAQALVRAPIAALRRRHPRGTLTLLHVAGGGSSVAHGDIGPYPDRKHPI